MEEPEIRPSTRTVMTALILSLLFAPFGLIYSGETAFGGPYLLVYALTYGIWGGGITFHLELLFQIAYYTMAIVISAPSLILVYQVLEFWEGRTTKRGVWVAVIVSLLPMSAMCIPIYSHSYSLTFATPVPILQILAIVLVRFKEHTATRASLTETELGEDN
ncbi:MAG: hypothetical protein KAX20_04050 [Candidatus Omnitrophica bacterium]|nr:hypothetical protein [Candidatus Omnitrophota bacterium]